MVESGLRIVGQERADGEEAVSDRLETVVDIRQSKAGTQQVMIGQGGEVVAGGDRFGRDESGACRLAGEGGDLKT